MSDNNESRETVADIVAAMRAMARVSETFVDRFSNPCLRMGMEMEAKMRKSLADRIEAAWKRDEEHAVEHATRHAEAVARDNCRDCVHNPKGKNYEGGNAAAMREALDAVLKFLGNLEIEPYSPLDEDASELRQSIMAALAAPPRNCDVGTPEEQGDRFAELCDSHSGCSQCPVRSLWNFADGHKPSCGVLWAQMPYKAQEGAGK